MVAYEFIITFADDTELQRSLSPRDIFRETEEGLKDNVKSLIEREYGERPTDVWVCLHRGADGLSDQSNESLRGNCNHFVEFMQEGMIQGVNPNTNPNATIPIPPRWEGTNPSEIHRP